MAECVQVAVSNATFHFDKLYSYSVPAHLQDRVLWAAWCLSRSAAARLRGWAWCSDWMRRRRRAKG